MRVCSLEVNSILLGVLWVEDERRPAGVEHGQEGDAVHFRERDRGKHVQVVVHGSEEKDEVQGRHSRRGQPAFDRRLRHFGEQAVCLRKPGDIHREEGHYC